MSERTKAELVGEVLQRLAEDRFDFDHDGEGEVVLIKNYGVSFQEMEEFFREHLGAIDDELIEMEADLEEGSSVELPAEHPVGEDSWNDWCTERLLTRIFGTQTKPSERLKGTSYGQLMLILYRLFAEWMVKEGKTLVELRMELTGKDAEEVEAQILARWEGRSGDLIASEYARRLGSRFPRMIRRAEQLRALGTSCPSPPKVRTYLKEASECFVCGRFIASLLVCRSAIEFALRDYLVRKGKRSHLERLKEEGRDTLGGIIVLSRREFGKEMGPVLDAAAEINRKATIAVHEEPPSPDTCKEMFAVTRYVLQNLYI